MSRNHLMICSLAALFLPIAIRSAKADAIASGAYQGGSGTNATSGGTAGDGGPGYAVADSLTIEGGTFTGGTGGVSTGGSIAFIEIEGPDAIDTNTGGGGGSGVLDNGIANLTVTGGGFAGGNGGAASGSVEDNNTGGPGGSALKLTGGASAVVSGGTFAAGTGGIGSTSAPVLVRQLSLAPDVAEDGAGGYDFDVDDSVLTLVGTFENSPSPITDGVGTITGQLANNSTEMTYSYDISGGGEIILTSVPEPGSMAAIILAGVVLLRRRVSRRA